MVNENEARKILNRLESYYGHERYFNFYLDIFGHAKSVEEIEEYSREHEIPLCPEEPKILFDYFESGRMELIDPDK